MRQKVVIWVLSIGLLALPLVPQRAGAFTKVGKTAAQFLKIGVGARALAMGEAFAALSNDATALYWNPAGLVTVGRMEFTSTHTQWIAGLRHDFAGFVYPVGTNNALGLSVTIMTSGEIERTTLEQPRGTGFYYSATDFAVAVSYARAMTDFLNVGITGKYIHQQLWNERAFGFAVDVGTILDTGIAGIKVAMVMTNFGTHMKLDGRDLIRGFDPMPESLLNPLTPSKLETESWPLPTNFRLSILYELIGGPASLLSLPESRMTVVAELTHPSDHPEHLHLGMEYGFRNFLFLRMGYKALLSLDRVYTLPSGHKYDAFEEEMTFGAGVRVPLGGNVSMNIDYAYVPFGVFDAVQHVTLSIGF